MKRRESGSVMRVIEKLAESKFSGVAIQKLEQLAAKMGVDETIKVLVFRIVSSPTNTEIN